MEENHSGLQKESDEMESGKAVLSSIHTPYDDVIPSSDEPSAKFYLEVIRVYLGICSGTVSFEEAIDAVEELKDNPEFAKSPTDPTVLPVNDRLKERLLDNLETVRKYKMCTADSIRSAYSFAFLNQDAPISPTDSEVLTFFAERPTATLVDCADELGYTSRTVSRSLKRLRERNSIRFSCIVDQSAFGITSAIVFFKLRDDVEWESVEAALSAFPFTKAILKTTMSPLGYFSVLYPTTDENRRIFQASLDKLSNKMFSYMGYHEQQAAGATSNFSLFSDDEWHFPETFEHKLDPDVEIESLPPLLRNRGKMESVQPKEYAVISQLTQNARASPSRVHTRLQRLGWDLTSRQVGYLIRRIRDEELVLPYLTVGGLRISASFCFEILCAPEWRNRLVYAAADIPQAIYYQSDQGVIVWAQVPAKHQVEYYQAFRSLEQNEGVWSVNPIMTIAQKGSRTMLDIAREWNYSDGTWHVPSHDLDLADYFY